MSQSSRNRQETEFVDFIREGNLQGVKTILLENGSNDKSNPFLEKKFGQFRETALHLAVKYGHEEIVKLLLENRADIHATDFYKRTILHTSADENEGTKIMTLILNGVNVNAKDEFGNTPVKLAAEKGNRDAVRLLLEKGADVKIADKGENTTLHVAAKKGHIQVLEMLLEKLANTEIIGKLNKDKNTPLHLAVEKQSQECVAMLLNSGATTTTAVKNENGQTAADLANDHGDKGIIDFLKDPKKAKEKMAKSPSCTSSPELGRGCSVESDSPIREGSCQVSLPGQQGLQLPPNAFPVQVNANQLIINQHYETTVNAGNVAIGPGSQVGNVQDPTAMARPQPLPAGESHYEVNVNDGNVSVGDYSRIDVNTGATRTPSTAGSSDVPFSFPQPEENTDTSSASVTGAFPCGKSSGSPTENPSSFEATKTLPHPVAEESPGEKSNASLAHPVQEENPSDKSNASLPRPVQEENPADKSFSSPVQEEFPKGKENASLSHPVQEEVPMENANTSLPPPVQEESPTGKANTSLPPPVQEESPTGNANTSLPPPVQEESPTEKANTALPPPVQEESSTGKENASLSGPVQEESPTGKADTSLPYSVPEEKPAQKPDGQVSSSCPEELCASLHSMRIQTNTEGDLTPAGDHRIAGEAEPTRSSTGERATESIRPGAVKNTATKTVGSVRNDNTEEAIAPSDTVGATGDSRIVTNPGPVEDTRAFRSTLSDNTSFKPGASLGQTWQGTVGRGNERRASRLSRSAPKEVQGRLLKQFDNSPSHEMLGLDELVPESQKWSGEVESQSKKEQWAGVVTKGKNTDRSDVAFHRAPLTKCSGPSLLLRIPDQPKSDVEPNTSVSVSQNTASSNVGACNDSSSAGTSCGLNRSSTSSRSSSSSKESPHRKARHSREDVAPNGDASNPENHARDKHSPDSSNNLSSEAQSSADGDSASSQVVDTNPEDDHEGQKTCLPGKECRLM